MQIFLFLALIIAILAVIFAVQNTAIVTLGFLAWKIDQPLAVVILVTLAAGALISFFFSLPSNIRTRWGLRQQKKRLTDLEAQLQQTRTQLTELDTRLQDKDSQLVKLQDELVAIKTPPTSETAPSPAQEVPPPPAAPAVSPSPAKSIASFFKSLKPNTVTTTPASAEPAAAEPVYIEPSAVEPPVVEPLADEPPVAEADETSTAEDENPA